MTYDINNDSEIAPDCEKIVKLFLKLGPIAKRIVVRWSVTQTLSVDEQLTHGIR